MRLDDRHKVDRAGLKSIVRAVGDDPRDIAAEFIRSRSQKSTHRTHAPAVDIDPRILACLSSYKVDPSHQIDTLIHAVSTVLTAADAVTSHVRNKDMALYLLHHELGIGGAL